MKRKILYLILALFAFSFVKAENASNVRVQQKGKDIIITYDLEQTSDVTVYVSTGLSTTFRILKKVEGAVGEKVHKGTNLVITWHPLEEMESFIANDVRFKVEAMDKKALKALKGPNPWYHGYDDHPDHYFEVTYGLEVPEINHYVGARYDWIPNRFGFDIAPMYGIFNQELSATVGPTFRLTSFSSPLSLQLALGGGFMHRFTDNYTTWAADAYLRFGFTDGYSNFGWWSFGLGARYYDQRFIPTASISLMPVRGLILGAIEEEDFPQIYTEFNMGYAFRHKEWMFGGMISYMPGHVGIGGSFLVGLNHSWDAMGDILFRLTTDDIAMDLQLYQGFGYAKFAERGYGNFAMETGLRFAFGEDLPYWGLWSFNIGCMYDITGDPVITFGVSLPIAFVVGTMGMAIPVFL